jgi:hypothetical protein
MKNGAFVIEYASTNSKLQSWQNAKVCCTVSRLGSLLEKPIELLSFIDERLFLRNHVYFRHRYENEEKEFLLINYVNTVQNIDLQKLWIHYVNNLSDPFVIRRLSFNTTTPVYDMIRWEKMCLSPSGMYLAAHASSKWGGEYFIVIYDCRDIFDESIKIEPTKRILLSTSGQMMADYAEEQYGNEDIEMYWLNDNVLKYTEHMIDRATEKKGTSKGIIFKNSNGEFEQFIDDYRMESNNI